MAEMGRYCKAYVVKDLRRYSDWSEDLDNLQPEQNEDGDTTERTSLSDDDILYLQENYVVTDGIFKDEHIVFDKVTDAWKTFCTEELKFEIPVYEPIEIVSAEGEDDSEGAAEGDSTDA